MAQLEPGSLDSSLPPTPKAVVEEIVLRHRRHPIDHETLKLPTAKGKKSILEAHLAGLRS